MTTIPKGTKVVGLSLSRCILDIASGKIRECDVVKIIAGTRHGDEEKWKAAETELAMGPWVKHPSAVAILRRLRAEGKIFQPRIDKTHLPEKPSDGSVWIVAHPNDAVTKTALTTTLQTPWWKRIRLFGHNN